MGTLKVQTKEEENKLSMTFRDYIVTITKFYTNSQTDMVLLLFEMAGCSKDISIDSAKSWVSTGDGKRNCRIKNYFPNRRINESNLIYFFKSSIKTDWKELQDAFRSIDDDNIVDMSTDKEDMFFWSLLRQFQKIHNLPLSKRESTPNTSTYNNEMIRIFKEAAEYYRIADFITYTPTFISFITETSNCDMPKLATRFIEEIKNNIITPFKSCQQEILYIKIYQFLCNLKEYAEYLTVHDPPPFYMDSDIMPIIATNKIKNQMLLFNEEPSTSFEKVTERYRTQLKRMYDEICNTCTS